MTAISDAMRNAVLNARQRKMLLDEQHYSVALQHPTRVELLPPQKAKEWLATSKGNRALRPQRIDAMARDMRNGEWKDDVADNFHFHMDGSLVNGHHRCNAVIQSGITIVVRVMDNLTNAEVAALDQGASRSIPDVLAINHGLSNANAIAATVRMLYAYAVRTPGTKISMSEVQKIITRHPEIKDCVRHCIGKTPLSNTILASIYFCGMYAEENSEVYAADFVSIMKTGTGVGPGNPVYLLRERLIRQQQQIRTAGAMTLGWKMVAAARAWNLFRANVRIKKFHLPKTDDTLHPITLDFLLGLDYKRSRRRDE